MQRNQFATSNTEHPLQQHQGFRESMTSILETFISIHVVGRVNIASGCTGRGSACNHSWPIKPPFWFWGGGWTLLWQLLQSDQIKTEETLQLVDWPGSIYPSSYVFVVQTHTLSQTAVNEKEKPYCVPCEQHSGQVRSCRCVHVHVAVRLWSKCKSCLPLWREQTSWSTWWRPVSPDGSSMYTQGKHESLRGNQKKKKRHTCSHAGAETHTLFGCF